MTEINKNIPNYGRNIEGCERIDKHPQKNDKEDIKQEVEQTQNNVVPDPGVLGRSQVKSAKGADISKSVDQAVSLAEKNPALLSSCEYIFDRMYDEYLKQGLNPADAYTKASLAEEEFLAVATAQ